MKKIGIFGTPRSGTSWLSQILNSHPDVALRFQPLFSYGHKGSLTARSSAEEIRTFFEEILYTQDAFATMTSEMQKDYPIFQKTVRPTHIVFKETRYLHIIENILTQCSEVKIIGIIRNPLAVLASWVSAPKEFNPEWDINSEWRWAPSKNHNKPEEFFGFDKWKESTEAFLRFKIQFPQQFCLVRYDELNKTPLNTTKKLFDFCGLEVCDPVQKFLVDSKSRHDPDPYSVYRANASDQRWQNILPKEITKQIMLELKNTPLDIF
ncbi:MAG: Sulfotransferase family protein [Candidatus Nitrotoga sp. SPKER]|nr:MAG: Sulfotransferase family protein [Candidatus Nitrotoga sp. SPKER]